MVWQTNFGRLNLVRPDQFSPRTNFFVTVPRDGASYDSTLQNPHQSSPLPDISGVKPKRAIVKRTIAFISGVLARRFCVYNAGLKVDADRDIDCDYDVK